MCVEMFKLKEIINLYAHSRYNMGAFDLIESMPISNFYGKCLAKKRHERAIDTRVLHLCTNDVLRYKKNDGLFK